MSRNEQPRRTRIGYATAMTAAVLICGNTAACTADKGAPSTERTAATVAPTPEASSGGKSWLPEDIQSQYRRCSAEGTGVLLNQFLTESDVPAACEVAGNLRKKIIAGERIYALLGLATAVDADLRATIINPAAPDTKPSGYVSAIHVPASGVADVVTTKVSGVEGIMYGIAGSVDSKSGYYCVQPAGNEVGLPVGALIRGAPKDDPKCVQSTTI